jgi:ferredoxin-NADP reductase
MSEIQPETLFDAAITAAEREATHVARLTLDVPDALRVAHALPGQYVLWQRKGAPRAYPMALANAPGDPFELLVKDELERFPAVGDTVRVSAPAGRGFPIDSLAGQKLLLVGTGSGVAPLMAVVRALARDRRGVARAMLLYGAKSAAHLAYVDERARLQALGIEMHVALSGADVVEGAHRGRVTAHIPPWVDAQTTVFVCGQRPMMDTVTDAVVAQGVLPERVHRNF